MGRPVGGGFALDTSAGEFTAEGLINATGTWDKPFIPFVPAPSAPTGPHVQPSSS
ncbi:hypothetical protein HNP40_002930 [Mycobacteroides chelonae]|nr:hypothetical protein [Mycobacteroides chelonae]